MIPFVNLKERFRRYEKPIQNSIARVFKRGWFILGPELKAFELSFAEYLGVKHVVGVNSGTDAIFIALKALGVGVGDEVITVPNTATPTVSAIRMTGATPVFVDVRYDTHNLDPSLLQSAITPRTKAVLPVHLYGLPANLEEILNVARANKTNVIEDVAQAQGARYNGRMVGSLGRAGCFSFYPTKNLGAFGDAGAVVTDDKRLAENVAAMRNYGELGKFNVVMEGVNSRLDEIQAALLSWGLHHVEEWNRRRAEIAGRYIESLSKLPLGLPQESEHRAWHLFVIKTKQRDSLKRHLKENGVETMIHYPTPIHLLTAYGFLGYNKDDFPVTVRLSEESLSLPNYPELTDREVSGVCSAIKKFYEK